MVRECKRGARDCFGLLDTLANFDAIILDFWQNGGGNTPMIAYIASFFFGPKPVGIDFMNGDIYEYR